MFFSLDIVGSTAFKARKKDQQPDLPTDGKASLLGPAWASVFTNFYGFHQYFAREYEGMAPLEERLYPRLIKTIGDELMLGVPIRSRHDAFKLIKHFAAAIHDYASTNLKQHHLQLKGAAWVAGFPNTNHKVPLDTAGGLQEDYIGPSMDCGFRVSKFATPSKLMVTVDLALLLLNAGQCQLYCANFEPLKGVLENREYPLIWFPVETDEKKLDDLASTLIGKKPADTKALNDYCEEFIKVAGSWLCCPYFQKGEDEQFWKVPAEHQAQYDRDAEVDERNAEEGEESERTDVKLVLPEFKLAPRPSRRERLHKILEKKAKERAKAEKKKRTKKASK